MNDDQSCTLSSVMMTMVDNKEVDHDVIETKNKVLKCITNANVKEMSGCSQKPWTGTLQVEEGQVVVFDSGGDTRSCVSSATDDKTDDDYDEDASLTTVVYEAVMSNATTLINTAIKESKMQASFAEQTAMEMKEIIHWYNQSDNIQTKIQATKTGRIHDDDDDDDSQSVCLIRNALAVASRHKNSHSPHHEKIVPFNGGHAKFGEKSSVTTLSTSCSASSPGSNTILTPPVTQHVEGKDSFEAATTQKKAVDDICQRTKDMEEIARSLFSLHQQTSSPSPCTHMLTPPPPPTLPCKVQRNEIDAIGRGDPTRMKLTTGVYSPHKDGRVSAWRKTQNGKGMNGFLVRKIIVKFVCFFPPLVLLGFDPLRGTLFLMGWGLYLAAIRDLVVEPSLDDLSRPPNMTRYDVSTSSLSYSECDALLLCVGLYICTRNLS